MRESHPLDSLVGYMVKNVIMVLGQIFITDINNMLYLAKGHMHGSMSYFSAHGVIKCIWCYKVVSMTNADFRFEKDFSQYVTVMGTENTRLK